jgi:hypothetical protein
MSMGKQAKWGEGTIGCPFLQHWMPTLFAASSKQIQILEFVTL